ncbi:SUF system Fe-S cluster assembly protein [Aquisalinus flavus]|uniref:SUF system Fe-S cluster assembly protein n=1 Tax=Aquisalinus flavus TaxID=1526572 RepID=A0A8J2Y6E4_9PROT|nr:SUF system Fe-S cluster assembly protein [Aquisalinus flavus]MBD0427548.1 SUF system Fe-S cluster assembly protein [Aquisalinus flavus]UNE47341.1 SUF system Fe-S cluster assembly protein [Aquisalinus flavus]GGD01832.1 SUF system Fe-S cluster assembly protein [Aquisalinus flavus]
MSDTHDMIDLKKPAEPAVTDIPAEGAALSGSGKEMSQDEIDKITTEIVKALKTVYDPEIPVDIYELGLIYKVDFDDGNVEVEMTLTAPGCPVAGEMPIWVENAVTDVEGVNRTKVNMVFDPPWTPDRMSDEAKLELGFM